MISLRNTIFRIIKNKVGYNVEQLVNNEWKLLETYDYKYNAINRRNIEVCLNYIKYRKYFIKTERLDLR